MTRMQDTITSIIELYSQGLSIEEIAHYLSLNPDFVRQHVKTVKTEDVGFGEYDARDY